MHQAFLNLNYRLFEVIDTVMDRPTVTILGTEHRIPLTVQGCRATAWTFEQRFQGRDRRTHTERLVLDKDTRRDRQRAARWLNQAIERHHQSEWQQSLQQPDPQG